jgi:pimeloyl-ACP methyl ester carboxylesterase
MADPAQPVCSTPDDCSQDEHGAPPALTLPETLRRFEQEATRGVCDTGRYRLNYYSWGRGPALVMIPGLSDSARSFIFVAARLSCHFRCIAYDMPTGRGDGARMHRYTHADLVDDVRVLLDHLGIQQAYLLGSSFGSTVTVAALRAFPQRFPRAVLQGGFARRSLAPAEVALVWLLRLAPGITGRLPWRRATLARSHGEPFAGRSPDVWEYFLDTWGATPTSALAYRALLLHRVDLRAALPEIRQPVLMICGDRDPLVNQACEEELLRGLPRATRVEFPGCGHNPQYTHPELFAEVVGRFLTPQCSPHAPREDMSPRGA